jgi:hypothetical protein
MPVTDRYSQLGQIDLKFYDGLPTGSKNLDGTAAADPVVRATILAETDITTNSIGPSFTFQGFEGARALLRNVAEPKVTSDAATKYYVDSVASGLTVKGAVKVRTLLPLPDAVYGTPAGAGAVSNSQISALGPFGSIDSTIFDLDVADGATLAAQLANSKFVYVASTDETLATRFLVMDQAVKTQNGVYYLADDGSGAEVGASWKLVRSNNFNDDPSGEIKAGSFVFVTSGKAHKNHGFVLIADGATTVLLTRPATGANSLHFEQFSGAGQLTAGANLVITGDTIGLNPILAGVTSLGIGTVTTTGAATLNSVVCTNAATVGGALTVTGATALTSTATVDGLFTAKLGAVVTTGDLVVGTVTTSPARTELFRVGGAAYIGGTVTLTGVVNSTGTGRSTYNGSALVGAYPSAVGDPLESTTSSTSALAVAGAAYVHGAFTGTGAATLGSTLSVTGVLTASSTSTLKGAVTLESSLSVSTAATIGTTLGVTGATTLTSTLFVTGATTLQSSLLVTGAATLQSTLAVSGDCTITGTHTTKSTSRLVDRVEIGSLLTVTNLSLYGATEYAARLASKLGVAGDAWVDGDLRVMNSCKLGNVSTAKVDVGVTALSTEPATRTASKLRVAGGVFVDEALYVGLGASIAGDVAITGKATVSGVTNLVARTDVGTVPVAAADISDAMLAVYGTANVTGISTLRSQVLIGAALTVTQLADAAIASPASPKLIVNGGAYIDANLTVKADLAVRGDATLADALTVSGTTILGSAATITPASGTVGEVGYLGATVAVTGDTTFGGSSNTTTVNTLLSVTGASTLSGAVTVSNTLKVGATGAGNAKASTFFGTVDITGDVTVNALNKLTATGIGSRVGFVEFGQTADIATIKSTLTVKTVSFVDNNITTLGDMTCVNVAASKNVTATEKGTFQQGCYSSSFYATSDARLKRDVSTVTDALDKCAKLRGVTFKWVAGEDQRDQLGVIAQETQLVFPSLVTEHEGYLRVDYPKLVGLLIEAVKELDARTRPVAV